MRPTHHRLAAEAFVSGVQAAMWVGAGLTLAAALTAFIGLRGTPSPSRQENERADQAPTPTVAA